VTHAPSSGQFLGPKPALSDAPVGVVLAGTYHWDNSAFGRLMPRPLVPIANKPLITYGLSWLWNAGITCVTVTGNRETRALDSQLRQQVPSEMELTYLEDPMPRGPGGCLRDAADGVSDDTFLVIDGTSVPNVGLTALLDRHRAENAAATVVVYSEPQEPGGPSWHNPVGIYLCHRRAFESIPARGYFDIKEHLIPRLCRAGDRVLTYEAPREVPRVLNARTYLVVNELFTELFVSSSDVPAGYARRGEALVHRDAKVADDALLTGPILVGPGASVLADAVVVGPTSIGREAVVESKAVVSRSAVWPRARVGAVASLDRCTVADGAVIPPGARESNTVIAPPNRGARS
jgi:NDP-sugar pyrophosphorylase family protein